MENHGDIRIAAEGTDRARPAEYLTDAELDAVVAEMARIAGDGKNRVRASATARCTAVMLCRAGMLRGAELVGISLGDIGFDGDQAAVTVSNGASGRKRRVPVTDPEAIAALKRYLSDVRPLLLMGCDLEQALFVDSRGKRMNHVSLGRFIRTAAEAAGIERQGWLYLIRQSALRSTVAKSGASGLRKGSGDNHVGPSS